MPDPTLTRAQQAVVARLIYALESPAAIALLCGPPGVGKTTVLDRVVASPALGRRACERRSVRDGVASIAGRGGGGDTVLILDDAHECGGEALSAFVDAWHGREPHGGVVLAGEGRLLTLAARDARLERAVVLRAALGPFTLAETRLAAEGRLADLGDAADRDAVVRTIHEIAAGIPAHVFRLTELVRVVAAASPGRIITPDDVEAVHRRLALQAA